MRGYLADGLIKVLTSDNTLGVPEKTEILAVSHNKGPHEDHRLYTYIYVHVCMCMYMYMYITWVFTCVYIYMQIYGHISTYIHIYTYVYDMYVNIYV